MELDDLKNGRYKGGLMFGWRGRTGEYHELAADDWDALEKAIHALNDNGEVKCDKATTDCVHDISRLGAARLTDGTAFHWLADSPWRSTEPTAAFHLLDGTWRHVPLSAIVFIDPRRAA